MSYCRATDPVLKGWYLLSLVGDDDEEGKSKLSFFWHPPGDQFSITWREAERLREVLSDYLKDVYSESWKSVFRGEGCE